MHDRAADAIGQRASIETFSEAVIKRWPGASPIERADLARRFKNRSLLAGWKLPATAVDVPCDLILALPDEFPYALPIVSLTEPPAPATFPHIEIDGVACITSGGTLMEVPAGISHAEFVVSDAVELIKAGMNGSNRDEFLEEASTYWTLNQPPSTPIWYLSINSYVTAPLYGIFLGNATVVCNSKDRLSKWVRNARPGREKQPTTSSVIIHLPAPVFPASYPSHSGELISLIASAGNGALEEFAGALAPGIQSPVLFAFEHHGNTHLLGVHVDVGSHIGNGRGRLPLWHGYRKEHLPKSELLQRVAAAKYPVVRTTAMQIDSQSLLRRTTGAAALSLANANVAVIGCGSLGGQVIQLLAQAGVRRLTLLDSDVLTWQNVGRHVLSSKYVGQNKASAMKKDVLLRFPDYEVSSVETTWQKSWKEQPDIFDKHDLVISLTADWISDSLLNNLSKTNGDVPPVIFAWLEAHGLAGHVAVVLPEGGCLRCLTNSVGEYRYNVAVVPQRYALQREASCDAFYQPFSAASVAPVAARVVKAAIDAMTGRTTASAQHVWVTAKEDFDTVEATLNPPWEDVLRNQGYERIYTFPLSSDAACPVCRGIT